MQIAVVLTLLTFLGGCTAVQPSSAPAALQARLLTGRNGIVRIEVHVTPLRDLRAATLRLRAHGWRIQPNQYSLGALQPPIYPPRSRSHSPFGRPRSILRTFVLEPIAQTAAASAMLELQTTAGTLHKVIVLNHH